MDKGWKEITDGADMRFQILPPNKIYYPIIYWYYFFTSLFKPLNGEFTDWSSAFSSLVNGNGWPWAEDSIINQIFHINTGVKWLKDGVLTNMFI